MNFDIQIDHIVNYSSVSNVLIRAITSIVNKGYNGFCRIVHYLISYFALRTYKTFIFTSTQLVRVIHIHRFIFLFRSLKIPQSTVLARAFFVVHKSQKNIFVW